MHLAQGLAHASGGLEHIGTGLQVEIGFGGAVLMFAQQRDHRLGNGQIPGDLQHHDPIPLGPLEYRGLAETVDLVDVPHWCGVRQKNQPGIPSSMPTQ